MFRIVTNNRRERNWYDSIPIQQNYGNQWEHFSADKLQGNEIKCGDVILAKIPNLPGLIGRKTRKDEYGKVTKYVELITERWYDKEKQQTRNRRVCIGIDVDHIFRGMMVINEKYHKYFNRAGELMIEPKIEKKETTEEDPSTSPTVWFQGCRPSSAEKEPPALSPGAPDLRMTFGETEWVNCLRSIIAGNSLTGTRC